MDLIGRGNFQLIYIEREAQCTELSRYAAMLSGYALFSIKSLQEGGRCIGSVMHWMSTERCGDQLSSHCRWYSLEPPKNADGSSPSLWGVLGVAFSVFIFGFAVLVALPSVRSQMARPQHMPK